MTTWELYKEAESKAGSATTDADYEKWTKEYHKLGMQLTKELGHPVKKKYLVMAGHVISKNDGQMHRVGFRALCKLYKVSPADCQDFDALRTPTQHKILGHGIKNTQYVAILTPSTKGIYDTPNT